MGNQQRPAQGKADRAYDLLERMIVSQEIEPGSLVSEATLMARTGLGRTPVREALQRLARNQMVEIHPNRGALVPLSSVEDQLRMLEVRRELEALAVRLAARRATRDEQQGMRAMIDLLTSTDFTLSSYAETIEETHTLIAQTAHNSHLANAMAPLQSLSRRFWIAHVRDDDKREIASGAALHIAILDSILTGDTDRAERASLELNDYLVQFAHNTLLLR